MEKALSCRVCLQVQELMVHIFDEMEDLSILLALCGGLKIDKNDCYPKYLCRECTGELLIAAKFRDKCARTQKMLDQIIQHQAEEEIIKQMVVETIESEDDDSKSVENLDANIFEEPDDPLEPSEMSDSEIPETLEEEVKEDVLPQESQEIIIEYEHYENKIDHDYTADEVIVFEVENALEDSLENVIVEEVEEDELSVAEEENELSVAEEENQLSMAEEENQLSMAEEEHELNVAEEENELNVAEEEEVLAATSSIDVIYKEYQQRRAKNSNLLTPMSSASRQFVCDSCGAVFLQAANLKRHMDNSHQLLLQFTCDQCQYCFSLESQYEKHIVLCERLENSELVEKLSPTRKRKRKDTATSVGTGNKCVYCGKEHRSAFALNMHLRTHTGERPFTCEHCAKSFKTQSSLSIHLKRHAGLPDHQCPVCQKTFYETSNLTVHMRTHTGEKPHACQICGKRFTRVFLLQHHMRTHTGEKPYQCTICENKRAFAQLSDLRNHMRGHTGERNHCCPICPKTFIKRYPLLLHMKKHSSLGIALDNSSETVEMDESQIE